MKNMTDTRWLLLGAVTGLVAAGYGLLRQSPANDALPPYALASVNGTLLNRQQLEDQHLDTEALAAGLQRLIDEELLVQRGIELGMTESDLAVRSAIVNSLVASITAEADAADPTDEELRAHLATHAERFSYTSSLHVRAWETEEEARAQSLVSKLQSGDPDAAEVLADGADPQLMPDLPEGPLPAEVLHNYLGPAITAAAADMPEGSSAVFARRGRWLIVQVLAAEKTYVTDLMSIRNRVLLDYRRTLADQLLTDYLSGLRERADIRVSLPE